MNYPVPKPVLNVLSRLHANGFEAMLVGGCVRDDLLLIPPHDYDISTMATPEETCAVFSDMRVIKTGMKHGTVTVLSEDYPLEVTTYRTDGDYHDARHPDSVTFTRSLYEDAARRDFTVNALFWSEETGLRDYYGGLNDLKNKVLRCVGAPDKRLCEDALRILRALRFSATLGFTIEENTLRAMKAHIDKVNFVSRERVAAELNGLLTGAFAQDVLRRHSGLIFSVLPSLAPMQGCTQHCIWHDADVYEHTLRTLENTPRDPALRWAALLHDSGKPMKKTTDADGIDHFTGHQAVSAKIAQDLLTGLKMPNALIKDVKTLVLLHDRPIDKTHLHALAAEAGEELFPKLLLLRRADLSAHAPFVASSAQAQYDAALDEFHRLQANNACFSMKQMALTGDDLKAIGVLPGKEMGEVLGAMYNEIINDKIKNKKDALQNAARRYIKDNY